MKGWKERNQRWERLERRVKEDVDGVDAEDGRVKDIRKKTGREERERMREQ